MENYREMKGRNSPGVLRWAHTGPGTTIYGLLGQSHHPAILVRNALRAVASVGARQSGGSAVWDCGLQYLPILAYAKRVFTARIARVRQFVPNGAPDKDPRNAWSAKWQMATSARTTRCTFEPAP